MMPGGIPSISVRDAAAEAEAGAALIVDVRERDEFATERVAGVALVPLSEFVARYRELPRDRPLLMMCAAGSRSQSATMYLIQNGWRDVRNVVGGIVAWRAAGLPTANGAPAPGDGDVPS